MELCFATQDDSVFQLYAGELEDIRVVLSLDELGIDYPERLGDISKVDNAKELAERVFDLTGLPVFTEATFLQVSGEKEKPELQHSIPFSNYSLKKSEVPKSDKVYDMVTVLIYLDKNGLKEYKAETKGMISASALNIETLEEVFIPEGCLKPLSLLEPKDYQQHNSRLKALRKLIIHFQKTV